MLLQGESSDVTSRLMAKGKYTTDPEHMPKAGLIGAGKSYLAHHEYAEWSPERFIS